MSRTLISLLICLAASAAARADSLCERWAVKNIPASHPEAIQVETVDGVTRILVDLSALPQAAKVHRASLTCFTRGDAQPKEPVVIVPAGQDKPLALEGPWHHSFDATAAVQAAGAGGDQQLVLEVRSFAGFDAARTMLDICYEGQREKLPEQVGGFKVVHHDGQSFLMWTEVKAFRPAKEKVFWVSRFTSGKAENQIAEGPGTGHLGKPNLPAISLRTLRDMQGMSSRNAGRDVAVFRVRPVPAVRYRIYRHTQRITPKNILQAQLLGEQAPLSAFVENMRRIDYKGEFTNQLELMDSIIPTWCYDDYAPVAPGDGMYVQTPDQPGRAYYAVTIVEAGTENLRDITDANSLAAPVEEKVAPIRPILQRIQVNHWHKTTMEHWLAVWLAPPLSNLPSRPLQVVVTVPADYKQGWPMQITGFPTGFNMVDGVNIPPKDALKLFVEQEIAWFDALSYSNGRGTLKSFRQSRVDYYPERHLLAMIQWCQQTYKPQCDGLHGGLLHFGVRHPEIFGWLSFGAYTESYDFQWAPQSGALAQHLGPRNVALTVDGEPAWEQYNLAWYLDRYPERDIPFLYCISATGKDSGHTSEFGWQDDPRGWAALNAARQNFIAYWGGGRLEAMGALPKMPFGRGSIPAFSDCSLNNNPGSGDPYDGDPMGQINGWLLWDPADVVDQAGRWEMTVYLTKDAPVEACTVSVTPRWCKAFKPKAGESFRWSNTSAGDPKRDVPRLGTPATSQGAPTAMDRGWGPQPAGSGQVTADQHGLVTLPQVTVTKGKNRLSISR